MEMEDGFWILRGSVYLWCENGEMELNEMEVWDELNDANE